MRRALNAPDEAPDPLDHALADLAPGARLVLVVDQFEEVFVACRHPSERDAFLDVLVDGAEREHGALLAVLALRADFYGACAAHLSGSSWRRTPGSAS